MSRAVVIDTRNVHYTIIQKFTENHRLDFKKIKADKKIAVGVSEDQNFFNFLRMNGYECEFIESAVKVNEFIDKTLKNEECTVKLVTELFRCSDKFSELDIYSQNKSIVPAIHLLRSLGIKVRVIAAGIPRELRTVCDEWRELDLDDLLLKPTNQNIDKS